MPASHSSQTVARKFESTRGRVAGQNAYDFSVGESFSGKKKRKEKVQQWWHAENGYNLETSTFGPQEREDLQNKQAGQHVNSQNARQARSGGRRHQITRRFHGSTARRPRIHTAILWRLERIVLAKLVPKQSPRGCAFLRDIRMLPLPLSTAAGSPVPIRAMIPLPVSTTVSPAPNTTINTYYSSFYPSFTSTNAICTFRNIIPVASTTEYHQCLGELYFHYKFLRQYHQYQLESYFCYKFLTQQYHQCP